MLTKRIGILTSGGDCPGLNAVIRSVVLSAAKHGWETVGFVDGYEGLLPPAQIKVLTPDNTAGISHLGGTIIGTTNRGHFVAKVEYGKKSAIPTEIIHKAKKTLEAQGVHGLVCIGGDGSLTTALQMHHAGIPIVGVPKTIDNDLSATAMSFGFDSAVVCVVDALDRLHTTARSHKRVMVVEVMGRYSGWIALHGGVAGGADVILVPEIPFHVEKIADFIKQRESQSLHDTMILVAEGAHEKDKQFVTKQVPGSNNNVGEARLGGIAEQLAGIIAQMTGKETRHMVLGHLQRGGPPTALDRILGTRFGVAAVDLIHKRQFGHMVSYQNYLVGGVPIADAVSVLRTVQPNNQLVLTAREMGVCFGD